MGLFSYTRNGCHRNHRRLTLCGTHHSEGHEGRWQDCPECRKCGRIIVLSEGGYSVRGGDYLCERCTAKEMGGMLPY